MSFAVVFDLLVTLELDDLTVFQPEAVGGFFEVLVLDQYALERLWVKAKCGATL